jgi:UPF0042 nucleotide-binding protein
MSREVVVITGMSGAGRSTIAHALEDLGWYVIDNLPPSLLRSLIEMTEGPLAVGIDVRSRRFFDDLARVFQEIESKELKLRIVFVDASDDVLVRRFESSRRPHPLQEGDRILDGIARERERLSQLKSQSEIIIDTSLTNIHQLEEKIANMFQESSFTGIKMNILSFGYKYGLPVDADLVIDCRFIPNPHWDPELRPLNGMDQEVSDAVLSAERVGDFLEKYISFLSTVADGYLKEGKRNITLAVGCTGGKHRSVAIAQELALRINEGSFSPGGNITARASHRDLGREV